MALHDALRTDAAQLAGDLIELRHHIHRRPEIGLDLPLTQETVVSALDGLGLEVTVGTVLSSVTAVLRRPGGDADPAVLLRADMDALPVTEATGLDWASEIDGAMHACGHDLHVSMLVGAARLLSAHRDHLAGHVVFMFQPGEEGCDGAGLMIAEGVLDAAGRRVSSAYGMHVMSARYPNRVFSTRPGTLMAASDQLRVVVHGEGGHGSTPHLGRDPVTAAAAMVTALQTLVTRRFDVFDPVVLTVGLLQAGTRRNIIPDDAYFDATVRTFSGRSRERIREEAPQLCRRIGQAYGLDVEADYRDEYPLTVNDPLHTAFASDVVAEVFGEHRFAPMAFPQAGAEDFSRVLAEVPGCYLMYGATVGGDPERAPTNHSPRAAFDDGVLADGALLHAELAIRALRRDAATAATTLAAATTTPATAATTTTELTR